MSELQVTVLSRSPGLQRPIADVVYDTSWLRKRTLNYSTNINFALKTDLQMVIPFLNDWAENSGAAQGLSGVPTESPSRTLAMSLKLSHGVSWSGREGIPCRAVELHCDQARENYRQEKRLQQEQFHILSNIYFIFRIRNETECRWKPDPARGFSQYFFLREFDQKSWKVLENEYKLQQIATSPQKINDWMNIIFSNSMN